MKVLALIPARGGSKGLPRKNVLPLAGRPLLAWTVEAARGASCISRVILSTDDDEIIEAALACGCEVPFKRPDCLATDEASSIDVVLHAIEKMPGYDVVILLQPTSPLRTSADIEEAFQLMMSNGAASCVSVCPVAESPYLMYQVGQGQRMYRLIEPAVGSMRRQDLPPVYSLNGAIYIARTEWVQKQRGFIGNDTVAYVMERSRSIDIDTKEDFLAASKVLGE